MQGKDCQLFRLIALQRLGVQGQSDMIIDSRSRWSAAMTMRLAYDNLAVTHAIHGSN